MGLRARSLHGLGTNSVRARTVARGTLLELHHNLVRREFRRTLFRTDRRCIAHTPAPSSGVGDVSIRPAIIAIILRFSFASCAHAVGMATACTQAATGCADLACAARRQNGTKLTGVGQRRCIASGPIRSSDQARRKRTSALDERIDQNQSMVWIEAHPEYRFTILYVPTIGIVANFTNPTVQFPEILSVFRWLLRFP
jgi:hypothetical protein